MKILTLISLLIAFSANLSVLHAQQTVIHGQLIDFETDQAIPYAHIYFMDGSGGTTTNGNGEFKIILTNENSVTLRFTAIGYQSKMISGEELTDQKVHPFYLQPKIYESGEALVISESIQRYRVRNRRSLMNRGAMQLVAPPKEHVAFGIAQEIKPKTDVLWPLQFRVRIRESGEFADEEITTDSEASTDTFKFRLRFVRVSGDGKPTEEDLIPFPIYQTIPAKQGWLQFNLEEKNIRIEQNRFFILVEWLTDHPDLQQKIPWYDLKLDEGSHYLRLNPIYRWRESSHGLIFDFQYEG